MLSSPVHSACHGVKQLHVVSLRARVVEHVRQLLNKADVQVRQVRWQDDID